MTPNLGATRVEGLLRELAPQVLGAVLRRFKDFGAAEDAVQEALLAAAMDWPRAGMPDNPRGWLIQVAHRRLTDQWRSERARREREDRAALEVREDIVPALDDGVRDLQIDGDDTLALLFMCCHPALSPSSAIALTLRAVGGLTTTEIANAFMVPLPTMAQRISRAKQTIVESGVPFELPPPAQWAEQLAAVLHVLYLIFNEGYASSVGAQLQRDELTTEALRLTRGVHALRPEDGEVAGLLALMLLTHARRAARTDEHGDLISLEEQDRGLWDRAAIDEGVTLVTAAFARGSVGPYQLQAAIAALHDEAARAEETDWPQIFALYGVLERISDNPMVILNRAIALAMVKGPRAGLERLGALDGDARLSAHHRLAAVRAHLLERAGEHAAAVEQYRLAASRTTSEPEQRYLLQRASALEASASDGRDGPIR
jgi:RNA polymerase sigma factor (sigma-70 family)